MNKREPKHSEARRETWRRNTSDRYWNDPEYREYMKQYSRAYNIKRKYNLTVEQYEAIVARPCALCGEDEAQRVIDHDHETGRIRGALCQKCNRALGMLGDTAESLQAAVEYLETSGVVLKAA